MRSRVYFALFHGSNIFSSSLSAVNRQHSESLKRLLRVVVLCNRATVRTRRLSEAEEIMEEYQADMIMLHGSAAETALLKFVEDAMDNPEAVYEFRDNSRKVCDIPFNFALRFQVRP